MVCCRCTYGYPVSLLDFRLYSLHVLPVSLWVLSGYSSVLPKSKDFHDSGDSESAIGVNLIMNLSLCSLVMHG